MAWCQLIFDVSFTRHITSDSSWVSSKSTFTTELWDGLQFFGGLSVSLWTNVLAVVVVKVVLTLEGFNIRKNFYALSAAVLIPSIAMGMLNIALYNRGNTGGNDDKIGMMYTYSRTLSIIVNFVAYGIIAVRARRMAGTSVTAELSQQQLMINELSRRMIYYPLMQTVSRIGASIYEPLYGYGPYLGNTSHTKYSLACLYATTAPAAGIGYLIIFLAMQPYAYEQFVSILTTCKTIPPPESSVASSRDHRRKLNESISDTTSSALGSGSNKTSSNGFSAVLSRGSGLFSQAAANLSFSRDDSIIKYLDDDELLKAIKESGRAATRRHSHSMRMTDDRGSVASSMQSSVFSRGSEFTSITVNTLGTAHTVGSASLSSHSVEMSALDSSSSVASSFQGAVASYKSPVSHV